jgi:hypothetical protein
MGWFTPAAEFLPEPALDSIDLAYLELERPVLLVKTTEQTTQAQRAYVMRELAAVARRTPVVMLPPGFEVQTIGPSYTSAPPFELARWADDGGRV